MLVRHLCLLGSGGDLLPDLVDTAVRKEKEDIAVRKIVGRGCVRGNIGCATPHSASSADVGGSRRYAQRTSVVDLPNS